MASRTTVSRSGPAREAIEAHALTAALFVVCLPISIVQWIASPAGRPHPLARALDTARDAAAQTFSLPG